MPQIFEQIFEQSVDIQAEIAVVEQCFTTLALMHRWLNPVLKCEPLPTENSEALAYWSTEVGSKSQFVIQIPWLRPTLKNVVIERAPGLIVWQFSGFFHGRDRWQWHPIVGGTRLLNQFQFEIPNPVIQFGFNTFAARLTQSDMQAQLQRLKAVAEEIHQQELGQKT